MVQDASRLALWQALVVEVGSFLAVLDEGRFDCLQCQSKADDVVDRLCSSSTIRADSRSHTCTITSSVANNEALAYAAGVGGILAWLTDRLDHAARARRYAHTRLDQSDLRWLSTACEKLSCQPPWLLRVRD